MNYGSCLSSFLLFSFFLRWSGGGFIPFFFLAYDFVFEFLQRRTFRTLLMLDKKEFQPLVTRYPEDIKYISTKLIPILRVVGIWGLVLQHSTFRSHWWRLSKEIHPWRCAVWHLTTQNALYALYKSFRLYWKSSQLT